MKTYWVALAGLALGWATPAAAQQRIPCDGQQDVCLRIMNDVAESNKGAVEKFSRDALNGGFSNMATEVQKIHIMGRVAWAVGSWRQIETGPNHTNQHYHGDWGGEYVNVAGVWKVRKLSWSVNDELLEGVPDS